MTQAKPRKQSEQPDMQLPSKPTTDQKVDEGVKETFPASDPVAVKPGKNDETIQPAPNPRRSPDWLLEKR